MLQNATPLRKSAAWPPNSPNISDEHVSIHLLCCACYAKCIFPDPLQKSHACHRFWKFYKTVFLTFGKVRNALRLPRKNTSERPKVVRTCNFLNILTWKCASRHNRVHFSDILTSKSASKLVCFVDFDFEMCFAPQRRPLFRRVFISHLARWRRARRFSEPTFRPSGATSSFFWLFLFSDLLSYSLLFPDSSDLCSSICPYCRKFDF